MPRDYDKTHKNILECSKVHFLKHGFERASLREICKMAGITTGAFYRHFKDKENVFCEIVEPVIQEMYSLYATAEIKNYDALQLCDLEHMWSFEGNQLIATVEMMYANYDVFKLLLKCAEGTKYAAFIHELAVAEVTMTEKYMAAVRNNGYDVAYVNENEIHMLIEAQFTTLCEIIMHDYPLEEALHYVETTSTFFVAGWRAIFKI